MQLSNNKYKLLKEAGVWDAPSVKEEKILALQAEMKEVKASVAKIPSRKNEKSGKGEKPKVRLKTSHQPEKPSWFFKEPKEEDLKKSKLWNNKTWWFCSPKTGGKCDGKYRIHKPSECEGKVHVFGSSENKKRKPDKQNTESKLKLAKAYAAIKEVSGEEDSI